MAEVYFFNSDELLRVFNPRSCANYYNDPNQLELDIKDFLLTSNNQKWADEYSLTGYDWENDFKQLVRNFIQNKGLDYKILEKYCSRSIYQSIDEQSLECRWPLESKSPIPNTEMYDPIHWSFEQHKSRIQIMLVHSGRWKKALTTLLFGFLFYNFHALQAKAVNYKYVGGTCQSCKKIYMTTTTGSKTKYCSQHCRRHESMKVLRMRRKAEKRAMEA